MINLDWSSDESLVHDLLFADLNESEQALFERVHDVNDGCALLCLLDRSPTQQLTVEDIASQAQAPEATVEQSLQALADLQLVRRAEIEGIHFYGLSDDPTRRALIDALFAWQDRWHARLDRLAALVDGRSHA